MRDTADSLPQILRLAKEAKMNGNLSTATYLGACEAYEDLMIPRAFEWVRKVEATNPWYAKLPLLPLKNLASQLTMIKILDSSKPFQNYG
jgi:hypothetical protein